MTSVLVSCSGDEGTSGLYKSCAIVSRTAMVPAVMVH